MKKISKETILWWKAAGVRAVKTMAQAFLATIGSTVMITEVNWYVVFSTTALAGVLSLVTSIAGLPEVQLKEELKQYQYKEEEGNY